ncbi:MAG: ABC transporter substrate-binding protein [Anaerolineae bacterium]|nr:ABC transporter substrate-binding protein [Anaerolineae bacterium]MDQ7037331.1 ABC transporter substrate-binding protein [Anaerolineae bacterium]
MNKRFFVVLMLMLTVIVLAFAPVQAQNFEEGSVLNVAWPYSVPPTGHFNSFASGAITLGMYFDIHLPPLATLLWAEGSYQGMIASEFGWDDDGNYVVTVVDGVTWSDGSALSGADVMTTFNIERLRSSAVWSNLTGIEAVDDMTVKFVMDEPSGLAERQILITNIRPASVYGEWADQAAALEVGSDEFDALLAEFVEFRPEEAVASGPYAIDVSSINESNLMMTYNPGGLGADVAQFESVRIWNGETEVVTPLVANEELWYITHGIPPTTEEAFTDQGITIVRAGMNSGPAIYFNHSVYPLNLTEVRQAMAYVIDREQNGFVSLGESGVGVELMTGMSDGIAASWLSDDVLDALNTYELDLDTAEALLTGIGFSRNDDGIWVDDNGDTLSFELIFPQEFADWSAAAENATTQLNNFGFDITARGVQFQQQAQEVYDGNFQLAIRNFGIGDPIPANHYLQPYNRYNGQGDLAGEAGGGMNFDVNVSYSGGDVNLLDLANASGRGTDREAQAEIVAQLATSFNELLPVVPLWERYTNNALNQNMLSVPSLDDPIYANFGGGTDGWMVYLILTGQVGPAN